MSRKEQDTEREESLPTFFRPRILLAEDEPHLAMGIQYNLQKRGYEVEVEERGDLALEKSSSEAFDLIILDVMMPGLNGFEVCKELRARHILTPILMLTARHETQNRIKGIRLGADDYLGKPFDLEELIARIEALLRRKHWSEEADSSAMLMIDHIQFDLQNLVLVGQAKSIQLTAIEAKLLYALVSNRGRALSRPELLKRVWGFHQETQTRTLDNFIMRLRNHLAQVGGAAEWIESVRGVGYRFASQK